MLENINKLNGNGEGEMIMRVQNISDAVYIKGDIGKEIKEMWINKEISGDTVVTVGVLSFKKRQIINIIDKTDIKQNENLFSTQMDDWYKKVASIQTLTSKERANNHAWGNFKLFYWSFYKKNPEESLKERVKKYAERFYELNPLWIAPSVRVWFLFLEKELKINLKDLGVNNMGLQIFARSEERNLIDYGSINWGDKLSTGSGLNI